MLKLELHSRLARFHEEMEKLSLDCYLVTSEEDIWYFTNITYKPEERPFFLIIIPRQNPILLVPKLEESHVKKGVLESEIMTYWDYPSPKGQNWFDVLNDFIKDFNRIGIEENVKAEVFLKIDAKELVASQLVMEQRKRKSAYEIQKIKYSAKISDYAIHMIFKSVYKGASVLEPFALSRTIQTDLIRNKQFDPVTTSLLTAVWPAPISSMPHSVPNLEDRLGEGPNVAMAYFRINGYAAECERTFFLEKPKKEEEELFHHMMNARNKALSILKPGVRTVEVDCEARNYLDKQGLKKYLLHRTGHGVGLGNHEPPFVAKGSDDILEENMIITIEPSIYIEGVGGYRHSDTILITKDGYELLTKAPLDLPNVTIENSNITSKIKGNIIRKSLKIG